jgi:hypothetical protein
MDAYGASLHDDVLARSRAACAELLGRPAP